MRMMEQRLLVLAGRGLALACARGLALACALTAGVGCGGDEGTGTMSIQPEDTGSPTSVTSPGLQPQQPAAPTPVSFEPSTSMAGLPTTPMDTSVGTVPGVAAPPAPGPTVQPSSGGGFAPSTMAPAGATMDSSTASPSAVAPAPLEPSGPEDGDPSKPIVEVPGVACGPNPSLFGLTSTNVEIGGRGVHVAYPCNKHEGAPVTVILNLHGTMPSEELKLYQVAYFSANTLVGSHNFVTLAPKSVVSQWTNGDGGADMPHLMEVIDWAYEKFAKFDIRGMWVAGHSWGAMFTSRFACDPAIQDKVVGAFLQSGTGMNASCASRISLISSAAEDDIGPVVAQGQVPQSHGCGAPQESMLGNNVETYWPDCNEGFVHANYYMLGKAHADYIDAEVVKRVGDLINLARR